MLNGKFHFRTLHLIEKKETKKKNNHRAKVWPPPNKKRVIYRIGKHFIKYWHPWNSITLRLRVERMPAECGELCKDEFFNKMKMNEMQTFHVPFERERVRVRVKEREKKDSSTQHTVKTAITSTIFWRKKMAKKPKMNINSINERKTNRTHQRQQQRVAMKMKEKKRTAATNIKIKARKQN